MKGSSRVLGLLVCVALPFLVLGGCSNTGASAAQADLLQKVLKSGKIIVASDFTAPPMQFKDANGNPAGFTIEMIEKAGKALGVKVEWQDMAWESLIPSLKAGKVDMIAANMSMTLERMKSIRFTDPVMVTGVSVMVRAKDKVKSWEDLKAENKVIGTTMGSAHGDYVRKNWNKEPKQYEGSADWIRELKGGRIDAVMDDELLLAQIVKQNPDLALAPGYVRPDTYGWTFRQDASGDNLIRWFNWYLKWVKLTGEYGAIYEKFVGHAWVPNPVMD
jgi:polar amino acid transport system substrate-binding protein